MKWENIRILTVDDDPYILEWFEEIAKKTGITLDVAKSGEKALELIENNGDYDIYFVDWKMPGIDGIELTKKLKSHNSEPDNTVVIMISAFELSEIENEAKQVGVDMFLSKPLFPSDIEDIIADCIGADQNNSSERTDVDVTFEGRRILLAEDVEINREIVTALLEPTLLKIDCAENGEEAVRLFKESPDTYDMIFMDLQMPVMDGLEAARTIRSMNNPKAKTIPIVAMTANVFREDIENCLKAGMNNHIGKPIDFDEVNRILRQYLI